MKKLLIIIATLTLIPSLRAETPPARPNVLIIYTDDLDFDEVGAYDPMKYPTATAERAASGKPIKENKRYVKPLTPNIDRLINESMDFSQMRMVTTVCTPARYSLLTGQYCSRSKSLQEKWPVSGPACVEFNTDIFPGQWSLPQAMHAAGYFTGIVGKWHMSEIHRNAGFLRPPICEYTGKANGNQDPTDPENARRVRENYAEAVKYLKEHEGFDFVSSIYMGNANSLGLPKPLWEQENNVEWFTAGVVKFLEQQTNSGKPFFLYFAPNVPHGGNDKFVTVDPRMTPEGVVDWHLGIQPSRADVKARALAAGHKVNFWETWLDDGVGVILKKLEDLGLATNTIVIFSSDQQSRGKWTCYEGARVPFTVRWPGKVKAGSRCDISLASIDMVPTLLELCGGKLPEKDQAIVDGRSFAPCLAGGKVEERPVLIEMGFGRALVWHGWKYIALRWPEKMAADIKKNDIKIHSYIAPRRNELAKNSMDAADGDFPALGDADQLFDLNADMLEQHNLAGDPKYAAKLAEMKKLLAETIAPLPHVFGEFKTAK